jgi:hypothetical protein
MHWIKYYKIQFITCTSFILVMDVFYELHFIKCIGWLIYWLKSITVKKNTKKYWNTAGGRGGKLIEDFRLSREDLRNWPRDKLGLTVLTFIFETDPATSRGWLCLLLSRQCRQKKAKQKAENRHHVPGSIITECLDMDELQITQS